MMTTRWWTTSVCGYSSWSIRFFASVSVREPVGLRLHPAGDERGEVERGVAVEVELVVDELVGGVGAHALGGQPVLRDVVGEASARRRSGCGVSSESSLSVCTAVPPVIGMGPSMMA